MVTLPKNFWTNVLGSEIVI